MFRYAVGSNGIKWSLNDHILVIFKMFLALKLVYKLFKCRFVYSCQIVIDIIELAVNIEKIINQENTD